MYRPTRPNSLRSWLNPPAPFFLVNDIFIVMKFIITESQDEMLKLEKQSDILYKLFEAMYPDNYDVVKESRYGDETEVYSNEERDQLLFYYKWRNKEFYIGTTFIDELYNISHIDFLNPELMERGSPDREEFDNMIKVFAKRHYGWTVNKVWLHWY